MKKEKFLKSWGALSRVEEQYQQIFISVEILHQNPSGNGNTAFKSVAWRIFWSWTLAISSLFSSGLNKFKSATHVKTLKNIVDKKQVEIKETIKIISSLNAFRNMFVSEVLKPVKLLLLVLSTNVAPDVVQSQNL